MRLLAGLILIEQSQLQGFVLLLRPVFDLPVTFGIGFGSQTYQTFLKNNEPRSGIIANGSCNTASAGTRKEFQHIPGNGGDRLRQILCL